MSDRAQKYAEAINAGDPEDAPIFTGEPEDIVSATGLAEAFMLVCVGFLVVLGGALFLGEVAWPVVRGWLGVV